MPFRKLLNKLKPKQRNDGNVSQGSTPSPIPQPPDAPQPPDVPSASNTADPTTQALPSTNAIERTTTISDKPKSEQLEAEGASQSDRPGDSAQVSLRPEDIERAKRIRSKYNQFRILVIGRGNAGKTTVLKRTCNTTDDPEVYDSQGNKISTPEPSALRGEHEIENTMVFKSNPGFCFHDSCGFEAGGIDELKLVERFLTSRAKERRLSEQVHAIWYCLPVDEDRPFTEAEKRFFHKKQAGNVPVILLFTKFDAKHTEEFIKLCKDGVQRERARGLAPDNAKKNYESTRKQLWSMMAFPPKGYVYLPDMHKDGADCSILMEQTAKALDDESLEKLFVTTQQNSLELCIEYAIKRELMKAIELNDSKLQLKKEADTKSMMKDILTWFPQYLVRGDYNDLYNDLLRGHYDLHDLVNVRYNLNDNVHLVDHGNDVEQHTEELQSVLHFEHDDSEFFKLLFSGLATIWVADLAFGSWSKKIPNYFSSALEVFKKDRKCSVVETLVEALLSHLPHDALEENLLQVAQGNRLRWELLDNGLHEH